MVPPDAEQDPDDSGDAAGVHATLALGTAYKRCQVCGRVYPDRRTYLLETKPLTANPQYPNGNMPSDEGDHVYYELRNCSCGATLAERLRSDRDLSRIGRIRRAMFGDLMGLYQKQFGLDRREARAKVMERYEVFFKAHNLRVDEQPLSGNTEGATREVTGRFERNRPSLISGRGVATEELGELLARRGIGVEETEELERMIRARFESRCAVLVLDSSGFSRRTKEQGIIHFLALLHDLRRRLQPILESNGAITFWAEADNIYAVFPDTASTVNSALAIQANVAIANAGRVEASRLEVCIGIGWGDVLLIGDEDVFGDEMNLASKLGEDVAGPGEILLTASAWEAVRNEIPGLTSESDVVEVGHLQVSFFRLVQSRVGSSDAF
ncbi:MAG: adenylate/guanylate cyclase domain-containing protein [Deltaproteobacteria bacterium]|nr:adenylate/guanylate cyclase domain-containing protein [Deltaproteobacteria bacterium]